MNTELGVAWLACTFCTLRRDRPCRRIIFRTCPVPYSVPVASLVSSRTVMTSVLLRAMDRSVVPVALSLPASGLRPERERSRRPSMPSSKIAKDLNITARHVRRLWARFQATGTTRVKMGRPHVPVTAAQIRLVTGTHEGEPTGVLRTAGRLRHNHNTSYRAVYRIMKKNGLVIPSAAKSKKRGYVRFERKYSNAMWHADWHEMKDPRLKGLNLVTYLDDASRCITGAALFEHATSENAVMTCII